MKILNLSKRQQKKKKGERERKDNKVIIVQGENKITSS